MNILIPILVLVGLGIIFGVGLALASKKFCVEVDPRFEKIFSKLPGANCGVCGMAGCIGFAEGLIQGKCTLEQCVLSKEETRQELAKILGVGSKTKIKKTAVLHCHGGNKRVKDKFIYNGIKNCVSANLVMQGPKACVYGCIGYGSCSRICPFGAITMNKEDLPIVNEVKCNACGKCVVICPKKLFSLVPQSKNYSIRCKSLDSGKKVMDVCSFGCITCRKCEKSCPLKAIQIIDNFPIIDYNICENSGECFKACPVKTIAKKEKGIWLTKE